MKRHRGTFLGLALSAMLGLTAGEARAELISMTLSVTGASAFVVDGFADTQGQTTYVVGQTGITAINSYLSGAGSEYTFTSLGGSSNNPGNATQGVLSVSGSVSTATSGIAGLTLWETEDGYTAPTGSNGTLNSSSSGTFTNEAAGYGHTASSTLMSTLNTTVGPYNVLSTGTPNPNSTGNSAMASGLSVASGYSLMNTLVFNLAAGTANAVGIDGFSASATVTASSIPEPASLVTMLTGIPLPLVLFGLLRRRQHAVAQG